ncbi:hypothetical protein WME90_30530 [Sorangium sp. So ce375]|uniref:hypothetical protein n=1 Tax=Sorangium sp. So ce375 TaxID=3133306 RepID=UPI003F5C21B3
MFVRDDAEGAADIVRLTPPEGQNGELTAARTKIDAGALPARRAPRRASRG